MSPPQGLAVHIRLHFVENEPHFRDVHRMINDDPNASPAHLLDHGGALSASTAPWYLGGALIPTDEPTDQAGRAAMLEELAQLPFLAVVRHLLDVIGDGRPLTKQRRLFAADRKQILKLCAEGAMGRRRCVYGDDLEIELAWKALISGELLLRDEGWVRPVGVAELLLSGSSEAHDADGIWTEAQVDGARLVITAALEMVDTGTPFPWWTMSADHEGLNAALAASGPDGLALPVLPPDDNLIHCSGTVDFLVALVRHPFIHDVPMNRSTGHISEQALKDLGRISRTMEYLSNMGMLIVTIEEPDNYDGYECYRSYEKYGDYRSGSERETVVTYRAPVLMRGAIALLRERRAMRQGNH